MFKNKSIWVVLNLLFVGLALWIRLFHIELFHFDSDELSAIFRAQHSKNWHEHIQNGVIIDGHPAGMQTLIYFWVRFVGVTPTLLKILCGIISVITIYIYSQIAKTLFGERSALFCTVFLGLSWWFIDLGIWVRPYVFGGLFVSLTIHYLIKASEVGSKSIIYWILWSISLGISSAFHYFAFLSAGVFSLLWILGNRIHLKNFVKYGCLTVILLFIQYPIWKYQLNVGGLDWLGKPTIQFVSNHVFYIFGNSLIVLLPIISAILISIFPNVTPIASHKSKFFIPFIICWILPLAIGFVYSIYIKPVLQDNVLFFSTPFLILALSAQISKLKKWIFIGFIFILSLASFIHVFKMKKRFTLESKEVYFEHIQILKNYNPNSLYFFNGPKDVYEYYANDILKDSSTLLKAKNVFFLNDIEQPINYIDSIVQLKSDSIFTLKMGLSSGSDPRILPYILLRFSNCRRIAEHLISKAINVENLIGGQTIVVRDARKEIQPKIFLDNSIFKSFGILPNSWNKDCYLHNAIKIIPQCQSDDLREINLQGLRCTKQDIFVIRFSSAGLNSNVHLVSMLTDGAGTNIDYRYTECNASAFDHSEVIHAIKLADVPNFENCKELNLHWENLQLNSPPRVEILKIKGNPNQYGIAPAF